MPPLTGDTERRLDLMFPFKQRAVVRQLLLEACGHNLPFLSKVDAPATDRFRFAVLKLSGGNMEKYAGPCSLRSRIGATCWWALDSLS